MRTEQLMIEPQQKMRTRVGLHETGLIKIEKLVPLKAMKTLKDRM